MFPNEKTFVHRFTRSVVDLTQRRGYRIEVFPVTVHYTIMQKRDAVGDVKPFAEIKAIFHGLNDLAPYVRFSDPTTIEELEVKAVGEFVNETIEAGEATSHV